MDAQLHALPADALRCIYARLACLVDRCAMASVCRLWRAAVTNLAPRLPDAPLPAQLPWLLLPHAEGPTFSCLLSGSALHYLHVPDDARVARCFGSSDGGWVFLAFGQTEGHALLNLHTNRRIGLPNATRIGRGLEEYTMVIHAATLSSPPLDEGCIGAAIVTHALRPTRPNITFWRMGDAVASGAFGTSWSLRVVDIISRNGAFHCLTREERILLCSPVFNEDGVVDYEGMQLRLLPVRGYDQHVHGRYLVESRGELLMAVRFTPAADRQMPTSSFRVFRLIESHILNSDKVDYTWDELHTLGGRMLFIGQGCSRCYEMGDFPGFQDGIYFMDDRRFYNNVLPGEDDSSYDKVMPMGPDGREYPCSDNGKWPGPSPGGHVERCFFQLEQEQGEHTSPVWFLP
ncbi:uncharacterized protein LOC133884181 [Phragmites australis]|uniref:uncharacterized protein LOC133884181 n=1 Tax=Phragmites australis TaxID=29695 RepID=UPI002D7A402F|nr:uncharacterized protein LOC133884181 [Phragmites australis]